MGSGASKHIPRIALALFVLASFFLGSRARAGITNITSCGPLGVADETYVLQNDVSSDGTCFTFSQNGTVLDLNGHTVTYADLDFTGIQNPGLEDENPNDPLDAPGWDLSGAHGHAKRQDYTQQLFFDQHSLRIDNVAGDAYPEESVMTSPVYLPVAGKYAMTAEVKGGPYGAYASHLAIDGIAATCTNAISGMHMESSTDMSWGLICEFNIAAPATVRGKVVLSATDESRNSHLNVDEVDIRPIGVYGVANSTSNRSMAEIKNGSIIQGRSKSSYSPAIRNVGSGVKIHDLNITTNGINSQNIDGYWNGNLEIYNNYMEANGKLPLNRQYMFSMIELGRTSGGNIIYNNTLMNGPHVGINHGNATGGVMNPRKSEIYGNIVRTRITATNGFSIAAGGNLDIHDNTISPIQGHGIGLGRDSDNVRIYGNLIEPSTWPCSEYSSYSYPNSAHGIRIKNYASGSIDNLDIFNNTIIGKTNPQLSNCYTEVSGITNYLDDDAGGGPSSTNVKIHDNAISVSTDNYLQQHAMAYKGQGQGEIYNNTLTSNHIIADMSDNDVGGASEYKKFDSNTLVKGLNPQGFYTLRYGYQKVGNNVFTNAILQGGADLKDISFGINNGGASYSSSYDFTADWYLAVEAKDGAGQPISDAAVEIRDKNGNLVSQLAAGTDGKTAEELKEYVFSYKNSSTKSYLYSSPYTVTVSKSGFKSISTSFELDSSKRLSATLETSVSPAESASSLQAITDNLDPSDVASPASPTGLAVN